MAVYLDYAAATPTDRDVQAAMQPFFDTYFHNPSALYGPALEAAKYLELSRTTIAQIMGAKASEIIFTAGGTEANNLAIQGVMEQFPQAKIAYSAIEHDSVRVTAARYPSIEIPVSPDGIVTPQAVSAAVDDRTVIVSVMYANNEIGTVQPIRKIAADLEVIRRKRTKNGNPLPLYLHTDAAQAGNYLDLHVHRLGADLVSINAGKLYGPKQAGALYVRSGVTLQAIIAGGGQEQNLRSGTENVAGAVGLAAALKKSVSLRHEESARLSGLQDNFIIRLQTEFPQCIINGSTKYRLPNNVHVTFPESDNERVLMALDMEEIYAAAGSACSASHEEPSHVLTAIGVSPEHIRSSVRFSMGRQTTVQDIDTTIAALQRILA